MDIIGEGSKELLASRLQCMRDVNVELAENLDALIEWRNECCFGLALVEWDSGAEVAFSGDESVEW